MATRSFSRIFTSSGARVRLSFQASDFDEILDETIPELVETVSEKIAKEIRDGKTDWPVKTGQSRRNFYGSKDGIKNDIDYSGFVESRVDVAEKYAESRIDDVVKEVFE